MEPETIAMLTLSLFLIYNPFASLPIFISVSKGHEPNVIKSYANKATIVAGLLLAVFVIIGPFLMDLFGVTMNGFRVAGGLVLLLMAVETIFGMRLWKAKEGDAAWVIVATPILTGPGVITTAVLFSDQHGMLPVIIAGVISLAVTWVILRNSTLIMKFAGDQFINIMSKIVGLLIAAMAVEYIFSGSIGWFEAHQLAASVLGL
ncbi:MAG: MarC family protein [Methanomassiliicoccaceae archaeon]|jgi:multiple antibiotic resistance protein|nr:MarC family protein [Methanomassiliicoccaceae archaeon]